MNTKDDLAVLSFRSEYEDSGLSANEFAQYKGMTYWKTCYILQKALNLRKVEVNKPITFKELKISSDRTVGKEIRIKTSYGAEIIISL
jgi:hypothetical protein